jgi:hypothetical protein
VTLVIAPQYPRAPVSPTRFFAAQAYHSEYTYHDLVRPNGKPRSDAVFQADINFCYAQTGASRDRDTPAFKLMYAQPQMAV